MNWIREAWHHPRRLKVRRVVFQVHLWAGLVLALWVILVGLSGSILVFEDELTRATLPPSMLPSGSAVPAILAPAALKAATEALPGSKPFYITLPNRSMPFFNVWMHAASGGPDRVLTADARDGAILRDSHPAMTRGLALVHDFHVYLLLGPRGLQINAVLSGVFLVVASSGIVLWWPGVRAWVRGVRFHFRHNWRRINFDLHHAVGFWTLLWALCWGLSTVYFGFPTETQRLIRLVSPLSAMLPPAEAPDGGSSSVPTLQRVLATAQQQAPRAVLSGASLPASDGASYVVTLDTRAPGDFSHREIVTVSGRTGRVLSVWHYGANRTAGDWALWLLYSLHFGTLWGIAGKVAWALLGLSLPVLAITGSLMYWNRFLAKRWRAFTP